MMVRNFCQKSEKNATFITAVSLEILVTESMSLIFFS